MSDRSGADLEWRAQISRAGLDPDDPYSYRFSGARLEQLADEFDIDNRPLTNPHVDRNDHEVLVIVLEQDMYIDPEDSEVLNVLF